MIKKLFLIILLSQINILAWSQSSHYDFNNHCKMAYEKLLSLQLDSAGIFIQQEKTQNPNNLIPLLLENYRDFLTLVLSEDKDLFEEIKERKKERLELWKQGSTSSPWYLSGQAQIKLQWAFTRVLFDEYFTAATEINSAYHILEENKVLFPHFYGDNMGIGILHAMIGVFPDQYQWALDFLGLYGTISQGVDEMQQQLHDINDDPFAIEDLFYYTFVRLNLQSDSIRYEELLQLYGQEPFKKASKESPLLHFSKAVVLLKIDNDSAIAWLSHPPQQKDALHFYYSDFLLGQALLYQLDPKSELYFKQYIDDYQGGNYKKTALQRLSWWYFINNDSSKYVSTMARIPHEKAAIFDSDKSAQRESEAAEEGSYPNIYLLRSRLQFDGHYYQGALEEINRMKHENFDKETQLEYFYRKARIYHEMHHYKDAEKFYEETIAEGENSSRYFAAKAALKLGEIAELNNNKTRAANYYEKVLELDFSEYRKGIRAKAKAGLQRVKTGR
jgi:hypothetical protein